MIIVWQLFKKIYPVQLIACLTTALAGMINGLVVGNMLEAEAMVAVGFVVPLLAIIGAASSMICSGARIIAGNFMGEADVKKVNTTFSSTLVSVVGLGIIMTIIIFAFAKPIALLLGASESNLQYTVNYIRGISIGVVFTMLVPCCTVFSQMANDSVFAVVAAAAVAAANLALSVVLIKYAGMGVFGAGLASSLAPMIGVILFYLRYKSKGRKRVFSYTKPTGELVKKIALLGLPSCFSAVIIAIRNIVVNKLAFDIAGNDAVGVLAILNSLGGILDAFNLSLTSTLIMVLSLAKGEKNMKLITDFLKLSVVAGVIIGLIRLAIVAVFGEEIAVLFGAEGQRIAMTEKVLITYDVCIGINMVNVLITGSYQVWGRVKLCNICNVFTCFLVPIGFILLEKETMGIDAVWYCYPVAEVFASVLFFTISTVVNKHFPKSFTDLALIEDADDEKMGIGMVVHEEDDLSEVSEKLMEYLTENGVTKKHAFHCGLCLEEAARNIVENAFDKKSDKNEITIFARKSTEEIILSLRDNGKAFSQETLRGIFDDEDIAKNVGIRIIKNYAKNMNYQSTFGMNVYTIKV